MNILEFIIFDCQYKSFINKILQILKKKQDFTNHEKKLLKVEIHHYEHCRDKGPE